MHTERQAGMESWKRAVGALEEGGVFTKTAPGRWAGKETGHVPVITKNRDGSYTVVVKHGMTPGDDDKDDHWIEYVYARNAAGAIVGIQKFVPTDEKPTISFTVPEGSGAITPFSYCNLHGMWKGDVYPLTLYAKY